MANTRIYDGEHGGRSLKLQEFTPQRTEHWIGAMENLLATAEGLPPPTLVASPTWIERQAEDNPAVLAFILLGGLLAALIGFGIALTAVLILVTQPG